MAKETGVDGAAVVTTALSEICESIGLEYKDSLVALVLGGAIAGIAGAGLGWLVKQLIDWGVKRIQSKKIEAKFEMFKTQMPVYNLRPLWLQSAKS